MDYGVWGSTSAIAEAFRGIDLSSLNVSVWDGLDIDGSMLASAVANSYARGGDEAPVEVRVGSVDTRAVSRIEEDPEQCYVFISAVVDATYVVGSLG